MDYDMYQGLREELVCITNVLAEIRDALKVKESAPSASSNSDYAAARDLYKRYLNLDDHQYKKTFIEWCEKRLNARKAAHCA
jgi:hypothetical protein